MTRFTTPKRHLRRRRPRREGAVMLVVLLILMVATSAALLALHTVNSELQASGHERVAMHARGVSDAAMVTTVAWIDLLGSTGQWLLTWESWKNPLVGPPDMGNYPEPAINPLFTQGMATRVTMAAQRILTISAGNEVGIVCNKPVEGGTGGGGGGGGAGGSTSTGYGCESAFDTGNLVGSFGPAQAYGLPEDLGYVVDITDCFVAPAALVPGSPLGDGASYDIVSFNCTVTTRGRLDIATHSRIWTYGSTSNSYTQRVFASAHDARATIVTPEMIVPK